MDTHVIWSYGILTLLGSTQNNKLARSIYAKLEPYDTKMVFVQTVKA